MLYPINFNNLSVSNGGITYFHFKFKKLKQSLMDNSATNDELEVGRFKEKLYRNFVNSGLLDNLKVGIWSEAQLVIFLDPNASETSSKAAEERHPDLRFLESLDLPEAP